MPGKGGGKKGGGGGGGGMGNQPLEYVRRVPAFLQKMGMKPTSHIEEKFSNDCMGKEDDSDDEEMMQKKAEALKEYLEKEKEKGGEVTMDKLGDDLKKVVKSGVGGQELEQAMGVHVWRKRKEDEAAAGEPGQTLKRKADGASAAPGAKRKKGIKGSRTGALSFDDDDV